MKKRKKDRNAEKLRKRHHFLQFRSDPFFIFSYLLLPLNLPSNSHRRATHRPTPAEPALNQNNIATINIRPISSSLSAKLIIGTTNQLTFDYLSQHPTFQSSALTTM
ncbi:hypothetical protein RYX36_027479 [Vicia faba]